MNTISVNLLKNRRVLSEKDYQRERLYLRYSVFGAIVTVCVVMALAIWNFILARQLSAVEADIAASSRALSGLAEANAQQIYLKSRLQLITTFLDDRSIARESLQRIFSVNIPGTRVTSVEFISDNTLGVALGAQDIGTLVYALEYFQNDTGFFTQVISRGITRAKEGNYQIDLELTIPKEEA